MTLLAVTHETNFACRVTNHVVVFARGAIIEQGPPRQVFESPLVERTCDFLSHRGWEG